MIIQALLNLIYTIFNTLLIFEIPSLPDSAQYYLNEFFTYLEVGASILGNYTPLAYVMTLFGIILAVDIGLHIYKFVMWLLKKIPMISVS